MDDFVRAAKTADLSDGQIMVVEANGNTMVLSRFGDDFYAVDEACTHAQGPLGDGVIDGERVQCPWHGSCFSLKTGEVISGHTGTPLRRYAVRVEGGDVLIGPALEL